MCRFCAAFLFLSTCLMACQNDTPVHTAPANFEQTLDYFLEVALGSEYGDTPQTLIRWEQAILIGGYEYLPIHLQPTLDSLIAELNGLIDLPEVRLQKCPPDLPANLQLFTGSGKAFAKRFELPKSFIKYNRGLFAVRYDMQGCIQQGGVWVDTERLTDPVAQRHLLREELTQALGLMKDADRYAGSIFYEKWTLTQHFTNYDRQLIRWLYDPRLQTGMDAEAIRNVLGKAE